MSRKVNSPPPGKGGRPAKPMRAAKPQPKTTIDPEQAKRIALLQLNIGREAHKYSMLGALALALSGAFLILAQPNRPLYFLPQDAKQLLPWFIPLLAGCLMATAVVSLKWRPFQADRRSAHFVVSIFAFVASVGTLILLIAQRLGIFPVDAIQWVFPASFSGISLSLVSLAMTWSGWSRRKLISIASASFPMVIMFYGFTPFFSSGVPPDFMVLTFLGSAIFVHLSGAMLHIIASSTNIHEREVIRASNDKLLEIEEEVRAKSQALEYRDDALRAKEADLEAQVRALAERSTATEQQRKYFEGLQAQINKRAADLQALDRQVASRRAELEARAESIAAREQDLNSQVQKVQRGQKDFSAQSETLVEREKEARRLLIEAQAKDKEAAQRNRELEDWERRLGQHEQELRARIAELGRKEQDLRGKEGVLAMREAKATGGSVSPQDSKRYMDMEKWQKTLMDRENQVARLEADLRAKSGSMQDALAKAKGAEERATARVNEIRTKEQQLISKEKSLSDLEAGLRQKAQEAQRQLAAANEAFGSAREKEQKYLELSKEAHSKAATAATSQEEIKRLRQDTDVREKRLADLEAKLRKEQDALTTQTKSYLELQKDLEAKEQEITLRQMEMDKRMKEALQGAVGAGQEQQRALETWEKRLRDKEQEIKNRLYQKEKEIEMRERALQQGLKQELTDSAEVGVEEAKADRIKTGTPRLDDLLLGGLPMNAQVAFIGPAFVGKEVGILNFIAEGLKKGIPALIVTTSKPAAEVAKEMGPILPKFIEYEMVGLVKWIDASGNLQGRKSPQVEKTKYMVNGATDLEGILAAVALAVDEFKARHPYFRLAFFTLSTPITQSEEKVGMAFVQKLVNLLRQTKSVGLYAVERGMHSDQQIETLEHAIDGAIHFKLDRTKNLMMVQGIGEVQTRDWVEYKFSNRSLMIGSFTLERIR